VQAGVRQYRPSFDLWTIWGVFSPVPYHAVHGTVWVTPVAPLQLRGRWERFVFSDAEVTTPLVQVDDDGWRFGVGASYRIREGLSVDLGYHEEYGPGASSNGVDGSVSWTARPGLTFSAYGSTLERPLEFRFNEADVQVLGLDAEWEPTDRLRLGLGGAHYHEDRERPDAAALDWNQTRLHGRVTLLLGSSADRTPLPRALRTRPRAGVSRCERPPPAGAGRGPARRRRVGMGRCPSGRGPVRPRAACQALPQLPELPRGRRG
jgi:hypothetical protein